MLIDHLIFVSGHRAPPVRLTREHLAAASAPDGAKDNREKALRAASGEPAVQPCVLTYVGRVWPVMLMFSDRLPSNTESEKPLAASGIARLRETVRGSRRQDRTEAATIALAPQASGNRICPRPSIPSAARGTPERSKEAWRDSSAAFKSPTRRRSADVRLSPFCRAAASYGGVRSWLAEITFRPCTATAEPLALI